MYGFVTFILMFFLWILLSGKFDGLHLGLGLISSFIIAWLSIDLLFHERNKSFSSRICEAFRFVFYVFWLLYQILLANIHVIKLALSLKPVSETLEPKIITFHTRLKGNFARFILANSITLTPGTVTVRIVDDVFYVHAITRKAAGDLPGDESVSEMERRIAWVFERRN